MPTRSFVLLLSLLGVIAPLFSASAGIIVSPHKYAWSNNSGYINFEHVTVSDTALGGYAWSANDGWINFQPAQGGVFNDGFGNLSGYAWGEHLGWIHFKNVHIGTNGTFFGTATGELVGTITFDCPSFCDVRTDWKPPSGNGGLNGSGGGGGGAQTPTINPPAPTVVPNEPDVQPALSPEDQLKSAKAKRIDIMQDGNLNILDFNAMMVHWGTSGSGSMGDMNGDGTVDILDFNLLMIYWGITYSV